MADTVQQLLDKADAARKAAEMAADQAQPVEPLRIGQARAGNDGRGRHFLPPILLSVPESKREMFSRCL